MGDVSLSRERIHTGIVAGYNRAFNRTRHCPEISGKVNDDRGEEEEEGEGRRGMLSIEIQRGMRYCNHENGERRAS